MGETIGNIGVFELARGWLRSWRQDSEPEPKPKTKL
jgi:hypothetical protein